MSTGFVRFLSNQLRGYRLLLLLSMGMAVIQVTTEILAAFPLKFILDKVVDHIEPGWPWANLISLFDSLGTKQGLTSTEVHPLIAVIAFCSAMIITLAVFGALASYVQLYTATLVGQNVSAKLRRTTFEHILRLPLDWHGQKKSGDLVQRITGNVADVEKLIIDGLVDLLAGFLTLVGMVWVLLSLNSGFTLLSIGIIPALFVVVWSYTKRIKTAAKSAANAAGLVAGVATEDIRAIAEVKAFTLEDREAAHFQTYVQRYRASAVQAGRMQAEFRPLVAFVLAVSLFTVVGVGSFVATGHTFQLWLLTIGAGTLTLGTLTVFLHYLKQLYQPMRDLSKLMYLATNAMAGAARIQEVLDQPVEVVPGPTIVLRTGRLRGALRYEDAVFGYIPELPVIRGVNLAVEPGQKLALVGLSGSGKTTLVKLIPRFHDLWSGKILVDGVENRDYPLAELRNSVSFVLQDSVLFEGTIRDNIALGRPDATDRQIIQAAREAHIHETILGLPGGYDAYVREQGKNLSSGQRQRLAIARAMLRDTPILILDEPTASLDVEAEGEVMRALDRLVHGRTVIMISHRLSTLGHVDEIAVLDGGVVLERGDYATLKASNGKFAWLLEEQRRFSPEGTFQRTVRQLQPLVKGRKDRSANGGR